MLRAGLDIVRLNFSHGSHAEHGASIQLVRQVEASVGRPVGILQVSCCGPGCDRCFCVEVALEQTDRGEGDGGRTRQEGLRRGRGGAGCWGVQSMDRLHAAIWLHAAIASLPPPRGHPNSHSIPPFPPPPTPSHHPTLPPPLWLPHSVLLVSNRICVGRRCVQK
jgi:hypothetical protein